MKHSAEKRGKYPAGEEMKRIAKMRNIKYVNLVNAKHCKQTREATELPTLDGETLNPVSDSHFSPFMANVGLVRDWPTFARDQSMRFDATDIFLPQIQKLLVHLERKQWRLFDKQFQTLKLNLAIKSEADRVRAVFKAIELNAMFFTPFAGGIKQRIRERITFAENTSAKMTKQLVEFFQSKQKDESINQELRIIRDRWGQYYSFLAPIFTSFYWDDSKHTLDDFTLAQKRFHELKPFFVDCFETFCRISVIAAGLESVIFGQPLGVPTAKRIMPLPEFDTIKNGTKADMLKNLAIGGMFVPFIDHTLRNGLGHNSARYSVGNDMVYYDTENPRGHQKHQISYIRFCEKVVRLYAQLEVVSIYAHWLRKVSLGLKC
jgi:hypothetical protein